MRKYLLALMIAVAGLAAWSSHASTTVGDKIGFTVPVPGGDTDTWGTILNSLFGVYDELHYASRANDYLTVTGGGKLSWSGTQISWTSDIELREHVTAYEVSIQSASSPVTLSSAWDFAGVARGLKPASDGTVAITTGNGNAPNDTTDGNAGFWILAVRTDESTLLLPWANRELLAGDEWAIGSAQSWYESIASHAKPAYRAYSSDTSQVKVGASSSQPAVVRIDGKLYGNTSDATMDLDTSGRNGLDTGTKAANNDYYLYAIPATSGRGFDLVASATAPTTGPTGFSSWSYIGAFATDQGGATIDAFTAQGGYYFAADEIEIESHSGTTSPNAETYESLPTTAEMALGELALQGTTAGINGILLSGTSSGDCSRMINEQGSFKNYRFAQCPIETAQTLYLQLNDNTGSPTVDFELQGWIESPMRWK